MNTIAALLRACLTILLVILVLPAGVSHAQGGLLGGPDGIKAKLAQSGIIINGSFTQFGQGQTSGAGDRDWQFGGKAVFNFTFVGSQIGLWDDFFISVHPEGVFGNNINGFGNGTLLHENFALGFPDAKFSEFDLSFLLTQKFGKSKNLSVTAGKFSGLDLAAKTPLVGGGGLNTFMKFGLAILPHGVLPPFFIGGVFSVRTDPVNYSLMIFDPRTAQDSEVLKHPFSDGVSSSLTVSKSITVGRLPGFHALQGIYSTAKGVDFSDVRLPTGSEIILGQKKGYWYLSYSLQQFLMQNPDNPKRGWGAFGKISISDGNPNPFEWGLQVGLGGNSLFPGRELDNWGIGYYHVGLSNTLLDGLNTLGINLRDERGFEAFYNVAATPWLLLGGDLQYVLSSDPASENAVFVGTKAQIKF